MLKSKPPLLDMSSWDSAELIKHRDSFTLFYLSCKESSHETKGGSKEKEPDLGQCEKWVMKQPFSRCTVGEVE
jgi:hypothetical protein